MKEEEESSQQKRLFNNQTQRKVHKSLLPEDGREENYCRSQRAVKPETGFQPFGDVNGRTLIMSIPL